MVNYLVLLSIPSMHLLSQSDFSWSGRNINFRQDHCDFSIDQLSSKFILFLIFRSWYWSSDLDQVVFEYLKKTNGDIIVQTAFQTCSNEPTEWALGRIFVSLSQRVNRLMFDWVLHCMSRSNEMLHNTNTRDGWLMSRSNPVWPRGSSIASLIQMRLISASRFSFVFQ